MSGHVPPSQQFVFSDPGFRRWRILRIVMPALLVLLAVAAIIFVRSLFITPVLRTPSELRDMKRELKQLEHQNPGAQAGAGTTQLLNTYFRTARGQRRLQDLHSALHPSPTPQANPNREIRVGFYVDWDPRSADALRNHADQLTHVVPEWFTLTDGNGKLIEDGNPKVFQIAAGKGLTVLPLLDNLVDNNWQPESVENLASADAATQNTFVTSLLGRLKDLKAGGVVIDWEEFDPAYKAQVTALLIKLSDALHEAGMELWLCVPANLSAGHYNLDTLSAHVDHFLGMLHDQSSEEDAPGPIASMPWFQNWLDQLTEHGKTDQWIAVLGSYGYDWGENSKRALTVSFPDVMTRANYSGVESLKVNEPKDQPTFSYEDTRSAHTVWFLDADTFTNQLLAARDQGCAGIGIMRLGTEDEAIWDVLARPPGSDILNNKKMLAQMGALPSSDRITSVGEGEIVTIDESRKDGSRSFSATPDGTLAEEYHSFPRFPALYRLGKNDEDAVSLTFDDGPDPTWTPLILAILKKYGVKATFFLVGSQAEKNPDLVREILAQGHELGNHTYTHPSLGFSSDEQVVLELNATQRLIESITGRSVIFFRPPYNADAQPSLKQDLTPIQIAESMGYVTVLENIDPEDWSRPGTDLIVQRVKDLRSKGNIILLHDAGGNRQQTVDALPQIIEYLKMRGDNIVPLSEMLGYSRDDVMPPVLHDENAWERAVSNTGFRIVHSLEELAWAFVIVATGLVVLRTLLLAALAGWHRKRVILTKNAFSEPVSVVIAAFNEGKVIAGTLASLLSSDYAAPMEVIVVDDGSVDNTSGEVEKVAATDPRVRLLKQPNRGKALALRLGIEAARHNTLVFLDADTHFQKNTIRKLVSPLADPVVGAVAGHARVGNLRSFLARCQALEYVCGFNLDRRAYALWNCITVVPGAVSAFRKEAIIEVGGLTDDTLAEDTDLTLKLHRTRWEIDYAPNAIAWTEAPETLSTLAKQRVRWAFGTMQCLWKHRVMLFNPKYGALGWFSLPSAWFFQIVLVAITPIADFFLVVSLCFGGGIAFLPFFIIYLGLDIALAMLACALDGEPLMHALRIIPMRLIYRPLLGYVVWKSLFRALRGAIVGWSKIERTASVPSPA